MAEFYTYSYGDFTSLDSSVTDPVGTYLAQELALAGILGLIDIEIYPGDELVEFEFSGAVNLPILGSVVAAHTGLDAGGEPPPEIPVPSVQPGTFKEEKWSSPAVAGHHLLSALQNTFLLTYTPVSVDSVYFEVNGVEYDQGVDFVVSGKTITWLNTVFTLEADDIVYIRYWGE